MGVFTIITKGNINYLIDFRFTTGDFWMLGAAIGWALYSIYQTVISAYRTLL